MLTEKDPARMGRPPEIDDPVVVRVLLPRWLRDCIKRVTGNVSGELRGLAEDEYGPEKKA